MIPDFNRCTEVATKLLLKQRSFRSLRVDVQKLDFDQKIIFDTFFSYCNITQTKGSIFFIPGTRTYRDCLTIKYGNTHIILYNGNDRNLDRRNWSFAHEIGHIYLGHKHDENIEEIEANFFAAQLLMPEMVMRTLYTSLKKLTTDDVNEYFFVSRLAAQKRIQTLNSKVFSVTANDVILAEKFRDPIEEIVWHRANDLAYANLYYT